MTITPDIPDYRQLMLPLLRIAVAAETTVPQAAKQMAYQFALTREQRAQTVRGGRYPLIHHRVHQAERMLADARLTERPQRGVFRATARGRKVLAGGVDEAALVGRASRHSGEGSRHSGEGSRPGGEGKSSEVSAHAQRDATVPRSDACSAPQTAPLSPADRIAAAATELDAALRHDLLCRILGMGDKQRRGAFFEHLAIDLLLAMGYGGGRREAAIRLGGNNDGGVDAVILLDPLGLDRLYVQAKCYAQDNPVDVVEMREFAGTLEDKKTARGVLLTTSDFTRGALNFAQRIHRPITLIDGIELTRLMVEHGVGVRGTRAIAVKEVDESYFLR
jgi:restriction system protein